MLILGLESSCDETAVAIVRDGRAMQHRYHNPRSPYKADAQNLPEGSVSNIRYTLLMQVSG